MHGKKELPLVSENIKMSKTLLLMTKKSFGCIGVINKSNKLIGIITDGDLRRNMNLNLVNKLASEVIFEALTAHFQDLIDSRGMAVSFEMKELEAITKFNKNNIQDYL